MRLVTLTLQAFGPYPGEHTIRFSDFDSAGVYLISGPTGAGKSSILDAVVFALYGHIPRFDLSGGTKTSVRSDLASDDAETLVSLEFEVAGTQHRIERSPAYDRKKRRGSGTTPQSAKCTLLVHREGEWKTVASSVSEAGAQIEQIVGLKRDQFQQIIVLAQGRFAEFLHSDSSKREVILRRLFDSGRFQRATEMVAKEAEATKTTLSDIGRQIEESQERATARAAQLGVEPDDVTDVGELVRLLDAIVAERAAARSDAEAASDLASERLRSAEALARDITVREKSLTQLSALDELSPQTERMREQLDRSDRVHEVWPSVVALDAARVRLSAADERLADFDTEKTSQGVEQLEQQNRRLQDEVAVLRTLAETERRIPALETARDDAVTALEKATAAAAEAAEQTVAFPAKRKDLATAIDRLKADRDALGSVDSELPRLESLLAEAKQRDTARKAHADAVAAEQKAASRHQEAADATRLVLQQYYESTSARLAASLQDGEPCLVCGATAHPSPASAHDAEIVSNEQVDAAQAAEAKCLAELQAAQSQRAEASNEVSGLDRVLEGVDADSVSQQIEKAREQSAEHAKAADAVIEAEKALDLLEAENERLTTALEAVRADVTRLRSDADVAAERLEAARQTVRSDDDASDESVADRLARRTAESAEQASVLKAVQDHATRESELKAAQASFDELIADHPAEDEATVRAWRMTRDESLAAREQVKQLDSDRERITGVLAQPHIVALDQRIADASDDAASLTAAASAAKAALAEAADHLAEARSAAADAKRELQTTGDLQKRIDDLGERAVAVARLAATLKGDSPNSRRMRLETYVLAAQLEAILEAANLRLAALTDGRFSLEHFDGVAARGASSGLGVVVNDAFTGMTRSVSTLSGGETFLASLALALGLADVVQQNAGGISLETLFIDEGFGSLDAQTLELAMQTLSELHAGGRTIGVISHVTSMQERLPQLITVTPLPGGQGSTISVTDPN